MEKHIVLLTIGILIVIISAFVLFISKLKNNHSKTDYFEEYNNKITQASKIENEIMLKKIANLEKEIQKLKQSNTDLTEKKETNTNFKHMLNYNLFKETNKTIIDLYNKGSSKEQIAKIKNKSVREVEMIVKLAK